MLKIRLARVGKKKKPLYRVVISENTKDMYGDHLEILGQYNPHDKKITLQTERIEYWLSKGAQTSDTVHNLLVKEGVIKDGKKAKAVAISKKRKAKQEKASAAAKEVQAKAIASTEKPKPEVSAEVNKPSAVETPDNNEPKAEEKPAEAKPEESK